MWMVTLTTHWGRPPCHYVYSELLCEEWLSRLGSVLTAVLCEASEVVPKPPPPLLSLSEICTFESSK